MLDAGAVPRIDNMDQSVAALNHRRIGVLVTGRILERQRGVPVAAVVRQRHVDGAAGRSAALHRLDVVVNQQQAAVAQGDRIESRVVVGKARRAGFVPRASAVARGERDDVAAQVDGAAEGLKRPVGAGHQRGLDNLRPAAAVVERADALPTGHGGVGDLEVGAPAAPLKAGAAEQTVAPEQRLVLDGAQEAVGQPLGRRPAVAAVLRADEPSGPVLDVAAHLVEEQQLAAGHLEEHRIPAGGLHRVDEAVGHEPRRLPAVGMQVRGPNRAVGVALVLAAEEGNHQLAARGLDNRRRMARGELGPVVDELGPNDARRVAHGRGSSGTQRAPHSRQQQQ